MDGPRTESRNNAAEPKYSVMNGIEKMAIVLCIGRELLSCVDIVSDNDVLFRRLNVHIS